MSRRKGTGPSAPLDLSLALSAVSQAGAATGTGYNTVVGSQIDTEAFGGASVAYRIAVATQTMKVKIRGSIDGANWTDLATYAADTLVVDSGAEQTLTAGTAIERCVGMLTSYRYYDVAVANNVSAVIGTATVTPFAKVGGVGATAAASVTVAAALPAGTNAIGKLAAGTANIGDVDVASMPTQSVTATETVTGDTYADVTASKVDTGGAAGGQSRKLRAVVVVTVADGTIKLVGSLDDSVYYDLFTQDGVGADQAVDIASGGAATKHFSLSDITAKGAAALGFRYFKLQAKSTGAGVPSTINAKIFVK